MKTIEIYGASDDLVEVEVGGRPFEEIGCYGKDVHIVVGHERASPGSNASGIRVWMHYTDLAVWAATILQIDEGIPIPWKVTVGSDDYSVLVRIDCPDGTPISWEVVAANAAAGAKVNA